MQGAPHSTPLEDFLAGSPADTSTGELIQQLGLFGSLGGLTLALGLVVMLVRVHRGPAREVGVLLRVIGAAAAVGLVGAATEVAGLASIDGVSWWDALRSSAGAAPMLRLLGAALIVGGLFEHTAPVGDDPADEGGEPMVRWVPAGASALAYAGFGAVLASFWFDGHTATQGVQAVHAVVNSVHVVAGSIWFGGIVGIAIVALVRRREETTIAALLVRFSTLATQAVVLVGLAGVAMAATILDGIGDLTGTDWGRVLIAKVVVVAMLGAVGGYNHVVVVPALERGDRVDVHLARARLAVAVEVALLLMVVVFTVVLTTSSIV